MIDSRKSFATMDTLLAGRRAARTTTEPAKAPDQALDVLLVELTDAEAASVAGGLDGSSKDAAYF